MPHAFNAPPPVCPDEHARACIRRAPPPPLLWLRTAACTAPSRCCCGASEDLPPALCDAPTLAPPPVARRSSAPLHSKRASAPRARPDPSPAARPRRAAAAPNSTWALSPRSSHRCRPRFAYPQGLRQTQPRMSPPRRSLGCNITSKHGCVRLWCMRVSACAPARVRVGGGTWDGGLVPARYTAGAAAASRQVCRRRKAGVRATARQAVSAGCGRTCVAELGHACGKTRVSEPPSAARPLRRRRCPTAGRMAVWDAAWLFGVLQGWLQRLADANAAPTSQGSG